jgi:cytochrome c556
MTIVALEKQIAEKQSEIQNVLIKYNSEFETFKNNSNSLAETERNKLIANFESDRKTFKETFEANSSTFMKDFETQKTKFDADSNAVIDQLKQKLAEANKIVNIVGNVGITGNYQNIANQHKYSANIFRLIALLFMIIMSIILIYSINDLSNKDFNLTKSLVRILAASILTYPAVYAARESSKHRALETKNRNLELELASIGPFIELLPEEKKQIIKEGLVNKYFGNTSQLEEVKNDDFEEISINKLDKLLKTILSFIKR